METTPSAAEINTSSNSTTEESEFGTESTPFEIFVKTLLVLAIFPNLLLNPLMLFTLRRVTSIQPTTKIFMASLTLSDLCNSLWWILNFVALFAGTWFMGEFWCAANQVMQCLFNGLSGGSLLLLTVDRYIAISRPLRYPSIMTVLKSKIIVCSTWATIIVSSILICGIDHNTILVIGHNKKICVAKTYDWRANSISVFTALWLLTIFILYAHITLIARNQARRIAAENQAGNGQGGQRTNTRSATTIIIITGALIITWIPILILLSPIVSQNQWETNDGYLAFTFTQALVLSNGWMNVIIYYLRNRDLRQALCGMLSDWRKSLSQRLWG